DKNYIIKDINGIKLGMICYTNETNDTDKVTLNGMTLKDDAASRINTFSYGKLEEFYDKLEHQLKSMKNDGAEALVLFIHWGDEYQVKQSKDQQEMAQIMCDLGVDVIIGSHPHVVQPIELLTSKNDSTHKTVCVYSLGNAVSNQRKESMSLKTGHTEDGMLFEFTFAKYSDGTVVLEDADALPFWVNMFNSARKGKRVYQIIPLDTEKSDWKESFELVDSSEKKSQDSLERTEKIIGQGLKEVKDYLKSAENAYPKAESQVTDTVS
ncbi:MAG: CapA family protein, partial [Clostridia bacterium]|nr:CapA family protein [Clostridia bacterium]